ncbi:hypothetical protein [Pseudomonas sp. MPB23]|uniref:hypothetical protein n=1 Tax=Pseudomonas sp. MPB23 TaxID=3388490 RepID=UPI003984F97B
MASAGGKISFALKEVQPGATLFMHEIFDDSSGKNPTLDRIRFALVHLLLKSAVLAPKRSKNGAFSAKHIKVQLIRKKLVAPYLLC